MCGSVVGPAAFHFGAVYGIARVVVTVCYTLRNIVLRDGSGGHPPQKCFVRNAFVEGTASGQQPRLSMFWRQSIQILRYKRGASKCGEGGVGLLPAVVSKYDSIAIDVIVEERNHHLSEMAGGKTTLHNPPTDA